MAPRHLPEWQLGREAPRRIPCEPKHQKNQCISVFLLSVVTQTSLLNAVMLNVMLNIVKKNVVILKAVALNVVMLHVLLLNVIKSLC